jgi:quinol monooxygenase YgiN
MSGRLQMWYTGLRDYILCLRRRIRRNSNPESTMIHVIATITLNPGVRTSFLEVFRWVTPLVRAEHGCIEYQATIDVQTTLALQEGPRADAVTVVEKWATLDSLYAHTKATHMTEYREKVKDYVVGVKLQVTQPA